MAASATTAMMYFQADLFRLRQKRKRPPPSRAVRCSIESPDSMFAENAAARTGSPLNPHPSPAFGRSYSTSIDQYKPKRHRVSRSIPERRMRFRILRVSRIRARAQRVVDQGLAERPDGAGHPVTAGDHAVERPFDPCAILVRDDQRRQELDRMTGMAGDLAENLVLLEQGYGDELAEQPLACRFQSVPGRLQLERLRRTERDADHHPLAANVHQQLVARDHLRKRAHQAL